jgi:hypothetical protein
MSEQVNRMHWQRISLTDSLVKVLVGHVVDRAPRRTHHERTEPHQADVRQRSRPRHTRGKRRHGDRPCCSSQKHKKRVRCNALRVRKKEKKAHCRGRTRAACPPACRSLRGEGTDGVAQEPYLSNLWAQVAEKQGRRHLLRFGAERQCCCLSG